MFQNSLQRELIKSPFFIGSSSSTLLSTLWWLRAITFSAHQEYLIVCIKWPLLLVLLLLSLPTMLRSNAKIHYEKRNYDHVQIELFIQQNLGFPSRSHFYLLLLLLFKRERVLCGGINDEKHYSPFEDHNTIYTTQSSTTISLPCICFILSHIKIFELIFKICEFHGFCVKIHI